MSLPDMAEHDYLFRIKAHAALSRPSLNMDWSLSARFYFLNCPASYSGRLYFRPSSGSPRATVTAMKEGMPSWRLLPEVPLLFGLVMLSMPSRCCRGKSVCQTKRTTMEDLSARWYFTPSYSQCRFCLPNSIFEQLFMFARFPSRS